MVKPKAMPVRSPGPHAPAARSSMPAPWPGFRGFSPGVAVCLLLLLAGWAFFPVLHNQFVSYDDNLYVTQNPQVTHGLSAAGFAWAFRSTHASNWHPLTWLSHMLDCECYGLKPWGHHLSSVLWHEMNILLLFLVLRRLTGAPWRSLLVAALFGLHPLRVESVAWVAERKDVLSMFFFLLALLAYAHYAAATRTRRPASEVLGPPASASSLLALGWYLLALISFAFGLMSKPMLVTLPFVLLLLDYWPLRRAELPGHHRGSGQSPITRPETPVNGTASPRATPRCWAWLAAEKLPFFLLSAGSCVVTFLVQRQGGAVVATDHLPLGIRIANASVAYGRYLLKLFWPADLSVFYPYPRRWPVLAVAGVTGLLLAVTLLVVACRRRRPHLVVGWLWFLGTLVPVIGLVQVGQQSMADRYSYLPLIGILILLVWAAAKWAETHPRRIQWISVGAVAALAACSLLTRHQAGLWKDDLSLFQHALDVDGNNHVAHNLLGMSLQRRGDLTGALVHFEEATRLKPRDADIRGNLANALCRAGRAREGIRQFEEVLRLKPNSMEAHHNLGIGLCMQGRIDEGLLHLQEALRLEPDSPPVHRDLAAALHAKGLTQEAVGHLKEALRLQPVYPEAEKMLRDLTSARNHAP